ncbi:hypothetical protein SYNPS1DRAFT_23780 [Syncephalis pseudoplumigaleata]|uniref:Uncharacterized protein n=1 Tax=Syncephalis pseudoplumigaleata TaxID=1712513 RepID=A0A4P9YWA9_9FUNG|nr:hypothetical protein SYNPS1DRAFT_23780 [Syncephalis pseudoplumigaleata]|eukprot:RKP24125.1 hypothetical protein SYNPS1DRAFT_23780 [Syncephalis pseudoplumigaleata]
MIAAVLYVVPATDSPYYGSRETTPYESHRFGIPDGRPPIRMAILPENYIEEALQAYRNDTAIVLTLEEEPGIWNEWLLSNTYRGYAYLLVGINMLFIAHSVVVLVRTLRAGAYPSADRVAIFSCSILLKIKRTTAVVCMKYLVVLAFLANLADCTALVTRLCAISFLVFSATGLICLLYFTGVWLTSPQWMFATNCVMATLSFVRIAAILCIVNMGTTKQAAISEKAIKPGAPFISVQSKDDDGMPHLLRVCRTTLRRTDDGHSEDVPRASMDKSEKACLRDPGMLV